MKKDFLEGKKVVLGVTGSIAIYKAPEIIRQLRDLGCDVHVVMSPGAQQFMTPLVFQTLSGHRVLLSPFEMGEEGIDHIEVSRGAQAFIIAPATANIIGKLAAGLADDILTASVLAHEGPVVVAPAMNVRMWKNAVVKRNVEELKAKGFTFVDPGSGYLACGEEGEGRLAHIDDIVLEILRAVASGPFKGKRILVTGGATREYLDPVRFLTNGSTGIMGVELAKASYALGADVTLITGPLHPRVPSQINVKEIVSAVEMLEAVRDELESADVLIMSAAVADFRPDIIEERKIKKDRGNFTLNLIRTEDILKSIQHLKKNRLFVGFSAETHDLFENSLKKLRDKGLDFIVANKIPESFGSGEVSGFLISPDGKKQEISASDKFHFAVHLLKKISA